MTDRPQARHIIRLGFHAVNYREGISHLKYFINTIEINILNVKVKQSKVNDYTWVYLGVIVNIPFSNPN